MEVFGISTCIFIAADRPLAKHRPKEEFRLSIDVDQGIVDDGGAEDGYFLHEFCDVDLYCDKQYGVELEMHQYTAERADRIIAYIRNVLETSVSVEVWNIWLLGYWEYEDRPHIHKKIIPIDELKAEHIKELYHAENWNNGDIDRPWFHGIEIVKF